MDIILVFVVLLIATQVLLTSLAKKHLFFNKKLLNYLYFYHLVFFLVYYTYTIYNPSDSKFYYLFTEESSLDWFGILDTNNGFIHFLAYPFVKIGLSYESLMLIFSWLLIPTEISATLALLVLLKMETIVGLGNWRPLLQR